MENALETSIKEYNSLFFSYGLYILNYQFNLKKPTEDYISFEDLYIINENLYL